MINPQISPYFIILLWYPGFENLFSIIRKQKFKRSALKPDTDHLHQLIFFYFKKKKYSKRKIFSSLTGLTINIYNLIIFIIACVDPYNTLLQLSLMFSSVIIYITLYLFLSKFKKSQKLIIK